jgi:hypothetical protein
MKTISTVLSRSLMTLVVAGLGLAFTPRAARADIVFTVDESVAPGVVGECLVLTCVFDANRLNGGYSETLTINGDFTFDVSSLATFNEYYLDPDPSGKSALLNAPEALVPGGYGLYATFSGSGAVAGSGAISWSAAAVALYMDADQDNSYTAPATGTGAWTVTDPGAADDLLILSSATLVSGGGAIVPPTGGFFDLTFGSLALTPFGATYFPTLATLSFYLAVVDGDFDTVPSPPAPGDYSVAGDLDVRFAPEPATLLLLGLGFLGSGYVARRRRQ